MKRISTTLAVMAMAVFALIICIRQTIEARELLGESVATPLIAIEVLLAAALLIAWVALLRRRLTTPAPKRPAPARESRRRLSTV